MPLCEMCGREAPLVLAEIEGVELKVCPNCAKYGKIKKSVNLEGLNRNPPKTVPGQELPQDKIVDNYAFLLRQAREKRTLTQEEFAKFLNERESMVSKWEQGHLKPGIEQARRIGKLLGINLVEKEIAEKVEIKKSKSDEFTLGDFVKVRKRKG